MKINKAGLDFIKHFEGCELTAYYCPAGVLTIGAGSTRNVTEGMTITAQQADELLKQDVEYFEEKVSELVTVPLTSNQFSAIVSFTFTVGENALADSTLLRLLNEEDYKGCADQFLRWDKVDGEPSRRRIAERELFLTKDEETQPTSLKKYRERFEAVMKAPYDLVAELIAEIERLENS